MITASRVLVASREDVWALVAEPYHLPDWWPAYTGVEPDRRGLAEGARWTVLRSRTPGFLRKPRGKGLIVIQRVSPGEELAWLDLSQNVEAGLRLEDEGRGTRATAFVDGPLWRLLAEGARGLPRLAVARLYDLCQTATSL
ncbi:MAG TPA: SRPBCC family protein [Gaiellaceae bacterium]|nr:SRPBCC family protein [Gaiellaceae bacterium]